MIIKKKYDDIVIENIPESGVGVYKGIYAPKSYIKKSSRVTEAENYYFTPILLSESTKKFYRLRTSSIVTLSDTAMGIVDTIATPEFQYGVYYPTSHVDRKITSAVAFLNKPLNNFPTASTMTNEASLRNRFSYNITNANKNDLLQNKTIYLSIDFTNVSTKYCYIMHNAQTYKLNSAENGILPDQVETKLYYDLFSASATNNTYQTTLSFFDEFYILPSATAFALASTYENTGINQYIYNGIIKCE